MTEIPDITPETFPCRNCGRRVVFDGGTIEGFQTDYTHHFGLRRCLPRDSGRPWEERLAADIVPPVEAQGE